MSKTVYIYTKPGCSGCDELKTKLDAAGVEYIERSPDRWDDEPDKIDEIDIDARVQLCLQNEVFPVLVEVETKPGE